MGCRTHSGLLPLRIPSSLDYRPLGTASRSDNRIRNCRYTRDRFTL